MAYATRLMQVGAPIPHLAQALTGFSTFSVDASGKKVGFVFVATEDVTVTHLGFRYGTRTGTPPTYRISLQGLSAGLPNDTVLGGGSPASATFTPPADTSWNTTWQWIALSNAYALTRGVRYAIVIDYSSGTIDASNFSSFSQRTSGSQYHMPYSLDHNGTSWTKRVEICYFGYKSSSRVYGHPFQTMSVANVHANTTPDEVGLKFILPAELGSSFQMPGVSGFHRLTTGYSTNLRLYDSADNLLQETTINTDEIATGNGGSGTEIFAGTLETLTYGEVYRVTWQPVSTSTTVSLYYLQTDTDAEADAYPFRTDWCWTERTDGGAWTDRLNRRPWMWPAIDVLEGASGGIVVPAGMQGGFP